MLHAEGLETEASELGLGVQVARWVAVEMEGGKVKWFPIEVDDLIFFVKVVIPKQS